MEGRLHHHQWEPWPELRNPHQPANQRGDAFRGQGEGAPTGSSLRTRTLRADWGGGLVAEPHGESETSQPWSLFPGTKKKEVHGLQACPQS